MEEAVELSNDRLRNDGGDDDDDDNDDDHGAPQDTILNNLCQTYFCFYIRPIIAGKYLYLNQRTM
jgi:hypothetical protein